MKTLAIDTSSVTASAAVGDETGRVLCESFVNAGLTHSQTLLPMIEGMLSSAGLNFQSVDRIAVSVGPGSFTGVRIGVAAAKGLAFARELPCLAVSSLAALACGAACADGLIASVMDARCGQVYNALFDGNGGNMPARRCPDRALSVEQLGNELKNCGKPVFFVGDGAQLCYNTLKDVLPGCLMVPEGIRYCRGASVLAAAAESPEMNAAVLMPAYLRLAQAERNRKTRKQRV